MLRKSNKQPLTASEQSFITDILTGVQDDCRQCNLLTYLHDTHKQDEQLHLELVLPYPCKNEQPRLARAVQQAFKQHPAPHKLPLSLSFELKVPQHVTQQDTVPLDSVQNIIAIASGKGGVGKSSTTVNLALALQQQGATVGVLDADVYGPSIPIMLGIKDPVRGTDDNKIIPLQRFGIQAMSIGFLVKDNDAMVWRGPVATGTLKQLFTETHWGTLDYLLIDLPPGTGDIQLTIAQAIPVSGAVIVTTPQDIAIADVRRGIEMFNKVGIKTLGIIENMSIYVCPQCGHQASIFGQDGGAAVAREYQVPLIGEIPLSTEMRAAIDSGEPPLVSDTQSDISQRYLTIASRMSAALSVEPIYFKKQAKKLGVDLLAFGKKKK